MISFLSHKGVAIENKGREINSTQTKTSTNVHKEKYRKSQIIKKKKTYFTVRVVRFLSYFVQFSPLEIFNTCLDIVWDKLFYSELPEEGFWTRLITTN